ncbi:SPOR domain-containing protein [Paenibacillus koleovorans]|uniref:SPOR domain-containing protein n=1 Tax=Paenibacillus koleovorans TaxID=121608 RepID=UPI000FD7D77B|nr:SPOR domain-containing protein [Paenibacillus koleovorans]
MKSNKARLTYRFDHKEYVRREGDRYGQQEPNPVIPLTREEFIVLEPEEERPKPVVREMRKPRYEEELVLDEEDRFATRQYTRPPREERAPLNQFTTDYGSWSSPFDEETERVERMIRSTGNATVQTEEAERPPVPPAPARERLYNASPAPAPSRQVYPAEPIVVEGETGYVRDPYAPEYNEGASRVSVQGGGSRFDRYTRTPWVKIVASITGAITTGVLIGFLMLNVFDNDKSTDGTSTPTTAGQNGVGASTAPSTSVTGAGGSLTDNTLKPQPSSGAVAGSPTTASASSNLATVAVKIPARNYTLLQYGAFGNQQGAEAAQAELRQLGFGSAAQATDRVYVFAAIAASNADVQAMTTKLKAQRPDVFVKTITVPAVTGMKWGGKQPSSVEAYFSQASKLTTSLTNVTALHLKETKPGPIEDNTLQSIRTAHTAWVATAAPLAEGLPEDQRAHLLKMNNAMNTAVRSLEEYKKNPSVSYLWEAQSGVMQYALMESELLKMASVGAAQ